MMRQRGTDDSTEMFTIDILQEIYLRGRDEPVCVNTTFELAKDGIDRNDPVASVMTAATNHLLNTIDVVREHRYMLSDRKHNKFIWMVDEVQGVSIIAPHEDTVVNALEA